MTEKETREAGGPDFERRASKGREDGCAEPKPPEGEEIPPEGEGIPPEEEEIPPEGEEVPLEGVLLGQLSPTPPQAMAGRRRGEQDSLFEE